MALAVVLTALAPQATAQQAAPLQASRPAEKASAGTKAPSQAPARTANCPAGSSCAQARPQPRRAAKPPPPTTAEQIAALPAADDAQAAAADLVHYGKYVCDEKWEVFVERNPIARHYVDVRYKRDVWVMKPVASASGAVRLEDTRGHVLLVQIPVKSMLLNTQTGQRIVDSCQHDVQKAAASQPAGSADTPALQIRP